MQNEYVLFISKTKKVYNGVDKLYNIYTIVDLAVNE